MRCFWCLFCWKVEWRIAKLFGTPKLVAGRNVMTGTWWILFEPPAWRGQ